MRTLIMASGWKKYFLKIQPNTYLVIDVSDNIVVHKIALIRSHTVMDNSLEAGPQEYKDLISELFTCKVEKAR
jgi:hypothetical protein